MRPGARPTSTADLAAVHAARQQIHAGRPQDARLGAALRELAEELARERARNAALLRELDRLRRELGDPRRDRGPSGASRPSRAGAAISRPEPLSAAPNGDATRGSRR